MSGLVNKLSRINKKFTNLLTKGSFHTTGELKAKDAAKKREAHLAQYGNAQIPDEDQIKRQQRRRYAARPSSRADTVLTDRDRLGG